jgi:tRNA-specific 2-thiouridylase
MNDTPNKKVLVGMSGGVDSSLTAALLVEEGYEVIGAFMKNWSGDVHGPEEKTAEGVGGSYTECGWREERRDAMRVAAQLGIPFHTFDFEEEYRERVIDYMFEEYQAGRTPNPDVMCNKHVKFDLFLREADRLGCDYVATGHYARIDRSDPDDVKILAGVDQNKDQSYFLWAIDAHILHRLMFPLGDMTKSRVRKAAEARGLHVADKKDSTGICFVGEVDIKEFLQARIDPQPGDIVTVDGEKVGEHDGVMFYTLGQRKGLGVGGRDNPLYVVEKRPETNELVVGSNFNPKLYNETLTATKTNWFSKPEAPFACKARTRHRQPLIACTIEEIKNNTVKVSFTEPQRAITPGQSVVLYDGEEMIGGGIIE